MQFHLEFFPKPLEQKINYRDKIFLIGSCFTENMGDKLLAHKFSVLQNPNGILFNPISILEAIGNYVSKKVINESDLFYLNEAWHSWQHHSRFSGITPQQAIDKINTATNAAHQFLKTTDFVIITLGSAFVYELTHEAQNPMQQRIVANNHKAPAQWFTKKLLTNEEVIAALNKIVLELQKFNSNIKIIFTISPVRHLREGFVENNRSKAALINAVHLSAENFKNVFYFPAYELVIDDLRDYRFYAEDMVHPNYAATHYVWQKFVETFMDKPLQQLLPIIIEINRAMQHKPFNATSAAHTQFLQKNLDKILHLQNQYPYLNFEEEKKYFTKKN